MLGINIPQNILAVIFVIIGLMAAIGALSRRFDNILAPLDAREFSA